MSPNIDVSNEDMGEGTDGQYVDKILDLLKGVSQKRTQNILKMVGAVHNVRFVSAYAGENRAPPARKQVRARVQPQAKPIVKVIRSKIKALNKQISEKSASIGGALLPAGDGLIIQRNQLFRDLKKAQNTDFKTFEEAFEEEEEGAFTRAARGGPQGPPSLSF
jgi:hypothetical protein